MALLDDLGAWLAAQGVGTVGTDLYLGGWQDDPDAQVAVFEYGGPGPVDSFSDAATSPAPAVARPRVQVVARAAREDYQAARTKVAAARTALLKIANATVNGVYYERVEAIDEPFLLGRDEKQRPLLAANFQVWKASE